MTLKSSYLDHTNGGSGKWFQCEEMCRADPSCHSWMGRNSGNTCYLSVDSELKPNPYLGLPVNDHHPHTLNAANCLVPPPPSPPPPSPPPLCPTSGSGSTSCTCDDNAAPAGPTYICKGTGDPHYTTFFGDHHNFYGAGVYEHARFTIAPCGCEVVIQTFLTCTNNAIAPCPSLISAIAVRVCDWTFEITGNGVVTIRQAPQPGPAAINFDLVHSRRLGVEC